MSARSLPAQSARPAAAIPAAAQRFDRKFIEEHKLLERYLDGKLPVRGARDLEAWCRNNPEYLSELKLSERAQSSLKLLEACGKPLDLSEPRSAWWRSIYVLIGLTAATLLSLVACWLLMSKYSILQNRLEEARTVQTQGTLVQPTSETSVTIVPDRSSDMGHARILVSHEVPQLIDVHIDLAYTQANASGTPNMLAKKVMTFRLVVDKKDQGRALIVNNLLKDSNNQLRLTLNTTGLAPGTYTVRIEGLPFGGGSYPVGWMILEVK